MWLLPIVAPAELELWECTLQTGRTARVCVESLLPQQTRRCARRIYAQLEALPTRAEALHAVFASVSARRRGIVTACAHVISTDAPPHLRFSLTEFLHDAVDLGATEGAHPRSRALDVLGKLYRAEAARARWELDWPQARARR